MPKEYNLRPARPDDIPTLADHRRWMMEDVRRFDNKTLDLERTAALREKYLEFATQKFGKTLFAWVIEQDSKIVASASLSLLEGFPPHTNNLEGIHPYLHTVYTLPEYRRQGLARRLVEAIIQYARQQGLSFIRLNASQEGQSIYASLGFTQSSEMRLRIS